MDSVSLATMYSVIVGIFTMILIIVVWEVSRQRSRYIFTALQCCILIILTGFILEINSGTLDERMLWNDLQYFGHIFTPSLVLVFSLSYAQRWKWLSKRYMVPLFTIAVMLLLLVITNPLHGLHYISVSLSSDPVRSFEAERGPVYYAYVSFVFGNMLLSAYVLFKNYQKVGLALKRRTMLLELAVLLPLMTMTLLFPLWEWVPSELMIITGIMISSVLLFFGTFGFEMFRMLPFTFDSTVHTLKDGVLIADEFNQVLYLNPAMCELLNVRSTMDCLGKHTRELMPRLPLDVKEGQGRKSYQEHSELELLDGRFFDVQISSIYTRAGKNLSSLYILRDITQRRRLEEEQGVRMKVVSTLASTSSGLISISPERIPDVVQGGLSSLGGLLGVDRAHLFQFSDEDTYVSSTLEWCAPGVPPHLDELQGLPCDKMPWWTSKIMAQEVINVGRVADMPPEAATEMEKLTERGVRSLVVLPVVWSSRPRGFLELECVRSERAWKEEEIRILEAFSNVIGQAYDKRIADESIRISEEKFRTLFNNAGDSMFILSPSGDIIDVNPHGCSRLKRSRMELLGTNVMSLVTTDTAARANRAVPTLMREGSIRIEVTAITKDGELIISEASARVVPYERQTAILMINRDISERKAAESALRFEKDRLNVTLNNITDGVMMVDASHRVLVANRKAEEMLKLERGMALGRRLGELFPFEDAGHEGVVDAVENAMRAQAPFTYYRQMLPSTSAGGMLINESAAPIYESGVVIGAIVVLHDVTTEKKLENELERVERLRSLGALAGGIAHDFNNVLTILIGQHEVLHQEGLAREEVRARLEESNKALQRAKGLADQLLTFSKGGAPVKRPERLGDIMEDVLRDMVLPSHTSVLRSLPSDLNGVEVDRRQIKHVLSSIVRNADESMPSGGMIEIVAENVKPQGAAGMGQVHLIVRDEGRGMEESELAHLFEPFFSTKRGRSGMSLAVTYSIIKQHSGSVRVESAPGRGTTMHIYLPACPAPPSGGQGLETHGQVDDARRARVLLMDDEEMILDVASEMLRMLGHEAVRSHDGVEAVDMYLEAKRKGTPFDAVIMDLTIPEGMGGKEAVSLLLQNDPQARVIVSSGYSTDPVMSNYRAYGFVEVMPKPYTLKELEQTIHRTLRATEGLGT